MNVRDDVSTNWKLFRQAWEYYVTATELNKKSKEVQAGALCSVMGLECVKVMNSLTALAPEDKSDPEKILTALGNHSMPQKHLLFERVKFGFANQTEHETIDQLASLPMCGFIAQLVEHRTGIAEVTGSNPVEALIFSGFFFPIA